MGHEGIRDQGKRKWWMLNNAFSFDYIILYVSRSFFLSAWLKRSDSAKLCKWAKNDDLEEAVQKLFSTYRYHPPTHTHKKANITRFMDHINLPLGVPSYLFFEQAYYLFARYLCT